MVLGHSKPRRILTCSYATFALLSLVCAGSRAHHFPPGLEGTLLTLPTDGFVAEVLLLPAVPEAGKTTGMLISIRQAGTEQYYTGPLWVAARFAEGPDADSRTVIETVPRADLKGDREGRRIFRDPGRYVVEIGFQPAGRGLYVEFPLDAVTSAGPNPLVLMLVVIGPVIGILSVMITQRARDRREEKEDIDGSHG